MVTPSGNDGPARRVVIRTTDFDEAHRALEHAFLPMDMWPMEPLTALDMLLDSIQIDDMMTSTVKFGRDIGLRFAEASSYHVTAPVSGVAESQAGYHEPVVTTQDCAAVFGVDEDFGIHWRRDCTQMCLDFPRVALERRLEQHLDQPLGGPLIFEPAMHLTSPKGRGWLRMLRLANREARREKGLLDHPLAAKSVEAALVDGLLLAQPHNYSDALLREPRVAPPRAVREAADLLETHPDRTWSAPELANQVHLSVRALQKGFRRSIDTTPMRYLRQVRLRKVHDELSSATSEETTVAAIVYRWGILNQSRFAARYRTKFGESPSDTLRRR